MPWDKKASSTSSQVYATVGAVTCYKVKPSDSESEEGWQFKQWWTKGYAVQTGSLHWSPKEDTLYIGYDDGNVQRLKITDNALTTEVRYHERGRGANVTLWFSCLKSDCRRKE